MGRAGGARVSAARAIRIKPAGMHRTARLTALHRTTTGAYTVFWPLCYARAVSCCAAQMQSQCRVIMEAVRSYTTSLLRSAQPGEPDTMDRLLPVVYEELREMAHRQRIRERGSLTLNTTALVHEAYLKLVDQTKITKKGRAYFFAAAARSMRQVLVDYARRRKAEKRGGGQKPLDLDEQQIAVDAFAVEIVDLDDALERLAALNPRHAGVVECRFFGGLTIEETAAALGVSSRTVKYDWALARAWLYDALRG